MAGNQNSGRRPKPTALKVLQGNPGKRKLNQHEPKPPQGDVKPPEGISKAALSVWTRIAPVAMAMGTLTPADVWAFKTLCELQATFDIAAGQKDAPEFAPFTVGEDYNAVPMVKVHAALKLEKETALALRPYYEKFGLEPVGRARISVPPQEKTESKWEAIGL
jgi:P27 family predicted phage terminase small subunit